MAFERVTLGRTGLSVTRLGIAASYGTDEAMVEEAVERGVNYLWWGALRTKKMARGIRAVARKRRKDLVIVVHAVTRKPIGVSKLVEDSLTQLGVDHVDVLLLAGHGRKPDPRLMEQVQGLKQQGRVRFLGLSSSTTCATTPRIAGPRRRSSTGSPSKAVQGSSPSPAIAGGA
jgi:aryl-alcohol dehydrogenase-like predicted oxidoreductase